MFTGIVEEIGAVVAVEPSADSAVLRLSAQTVAADIRHGASIAVNGVCLTVTGWRAGASSAASASSAVSAPPASPVPPYEISFDVMAETLRRSSLGGLHAGDRVNLERAARVDSRLDGHVVQGHVDGTGRLIARTPAAHWEGMRFALPAALAGFVAEKGSIAVDGVSLTVTAVGAYEQGGDWFEVGLIPETLRATTLGALQPGSAVNLEVDVLAKYVARLVEVAGR